jgi:hypothetical protein
LHYLPYENLLPGRSAAQWAVDDRRIDGSRPFPERHAGSNMPLMRGFGFARRWSRDHVDGKEKAAPALFGDNQDGDVPERSKAVDSDGLHCA